MSRPPHSPWLDLDCDIYFKRVISPTENFY
jgi:hypothetical protein